VLEEVFRDEWGRVLASLVGFLGDFDKAEDAAQEAFAIAAQRWPASGQLTPLWTALHREFPQMAPQTVAPSCSIGIRLYRRVIEIRDGQIALRPYNAPGIADRARCAASAAGLRGAELEATVDAAVLAASIHAKRAGLRPHGEMVDHPQVDSPLPADLHREAAWLCDLATAFSSAVVKTIAAEAWREAAARDREADLDQRGLPARQLDRL
jgi:hypothetical protein